MKPNDPVVSAWFWDLLEQGRGDPDKMKSTLEGLDREGLIRFNSEFEWATRQMSGQRFARVHGDSEDIAEDVASWVVSQGRDYYAKVYADPSLFPNIDTVDVHHGNLVNLAAEVYEERFDEEIPQDPAM